MKKRTIEEKKILLKKLINFCVENDLMYDEVPTPSMDKFPLEVTVIIPNWKKLKVI